MTEEKKGMVQSKCCKCNNQVSIDELDYELFLEYYDSSDVVCENCNKKDNVFTTIEQIKDDEKVNDDMDKESIGENEE